MKKLLMYLAFALICMAVAPILQSCDDENSQYPLGNYIIAMATVAKETGTVYPYFVLDNGKTVWVAASAVEYEGLEPGQRVIGNFTILDDNRDGFDYFARVNNYTLVLTKDVINLTEANEDSLGNSKTTISDMWIGADYLNVEFLMVYPSYEKHMVNLVNNRIIPVDDDGYAHLEFRYNNMGDSNGKLIPGIVSFELGEYGPSNKTLKGLKVKINSIKYGDKVYTYNYSDEKSTEESRNFSSGVNSEGLK